MKIIVCGGRDFTNAKLIWDTLGRFEYTHGKIKLLVHGAAFGADSIAGEYAKRYNVPCQEFKADWNKYGKGAGPIRNKTMLEHIDPNWIIAFPGGKGTANMVKIGKRRGVYIMEVKE